VIADLRSALGKVAIDWVVERAFAVIPAMHPDVRNVIPCELRRWRSSWVSRDTRAEWRMFVERLRAQSYDAIIDTQGLLKSAIATRLARGRRFGLDWRSSREPLRCFYDQVYSVPRSLHAVARNRRLCGLALGYEPGLAVDYGLRVFASTVDFMPDEPFVVFLHATSHPSKLWPEECWLDLGLRYATVGCRAVLPWGNARERERAQRLAAALPGAIVPERMALDAIAGMLNRAYAVVGVDTGLTHLAAALAPPVVGIYGVTSPSITGVYGVHGRAANVGSSHGFPAVDDVVAALATLGAAPDDRLSSGQR